MFVVVSVNGTSPSCSGGVKTTSGSLLYYTVTTTVTAMSCDTDGKGGFLNSKAVTETVQIQPAFQVSLLSSSCSGKTPGVPLTTTAPA